MGILTPAWNYNRLSTTVHNHSIDVVFISNDLPGIQLQKWRLDSSNNDNFCQRIGIARHLAALAKPDMIFVVPQIVTVLVPDVIRRAVKAYDLILVQVDPHMIESI